MVEKIMFFNTKEKLLDCMNSVADRFNSSLNALQTSMLRALKLQSARIDIMENQIINEIQLEERLLNIEAAIKSVQIDFQEYCEKNPKHSDDWIEARLRALEHKVQGLELISIKDDENGQRPESYIQSNVEN